MDATDFNQLPVCTCCDLHRADRGQDFKYGVITLIPLPVEASALDQVLKLFRDWSKRVGVADIGHVGFEEATAIRD